MRIVIIDDSGLRATVLEEGLREAGYDDIHIVPPRGASSRGWSAWPRMSC